MKKKILVVFLLSLVLCSFSLPLYADSVTYPVGGNNNLWYGMGMYACEVEFKQGATGVGSATILKDSETYISYTHGFPVGVRQTIPVDSDAQGSSVSYIYSQSISVDDEYTYAVETGDSVVYRDGGSFDRLSTILDVHSNQYNHTDVTFYFHPFLVDNYAHSLDRMLYIFPLFNEVSNNNAMYVEYEFDYSAKFTDYNGEIVYRHGTTTDTDWWRWNNVLNNNYQEEGCFLPPSVRSYFFNFDIHAEFFITNLKVKIYDFQATVADSDIYSPNPCYYSFDGRGMNNKPYLVNISDREVDITDGLDAVGWYNAPGDIEEGFSIVGWLTTAVGGFLSFELFPGFTLAGMLAVICGIGCLILILKIFAGG